jgi:hypothetical protein
MLGETPEVACPVPSPAMPNGRCRLGAPKGKANGQWKHGRDSQESIELRRAIRAMAREARATLAKF